MYNKLSAFLLYILITVLVLALYFDQHGALESYEQKVVDFMNKHRASKDPGSEVVIVAIDDQASVKVSYWPWKYEDLNRLLYHLASAEPKTIAFSTLLPEYSPDDSGGALFADNVAAAGNVILPIDFTLTEIPAPGPKIPPQMLKSTYFTYDSFSKLKSYPPPAANQMRYPSPRLATVASDLGFITTTYGPDRKVRRQPLIVNYSDNYYPHLAVLVAKRYLGLYNEEIKLDPGNRIKLGRINVPVDTKSSFLINYYGPDRTFHYISAADIIDGKFDKNLLKGKAVLVGLTATGTDQFISSPVGEDYPEVEKTATMVHNFINQKFLKTEKGNLLGFLWIVSIGVLSAVFLPRVSLLYRIIMLLAFLFAMANINYFLYNSFGILSRTFYPALQIMMFLLVSPAIRQQDQVFSSKRKVGFLSKLAGKLNFRIVKTSDLSRLAREYRPSTSQVKIEAEVPQSETMPVGVETDNPPTQTQESESVDEPERPGTSGEIPIQAELPSEKFGRYQVMEPIGRGAMGTVYKGLDPAIDRLVALKTIRLDFSASPKEVEEMKERLFREARAAGKLSHPNIVTIYDVGQEEGYQYIAMEFLQGTTLERYIRKKSQASNFKIMAQILIQICDALDYAHLHGIVHRDIKPANIMVLENFQVKVMDFGIARFDQTNLTQTGVALGTPNYMPPELLKGKQADKRSDLYSLGVMTYELLTGKRPFRGQTISALIYSILNDTPKSPSSVNDQIPPI
ncbi:MAG: serine/threonine-protein kinase, partial [candidate division Zixibacteria bacterium]|nr:serine/threonine-protein kinase [candidate division Zixibacteria bacterium]